MSEPTMEEKLKICGRDFCVDIPDMDCKSCPYKKDKLLIEIAELFKIARQEGALRKWADGFADAEEALAKVKQHYVKWDENVVFSYLRNYSMAQISRYKDGKYYIPDDDAEDMADQLHKILTGG